MPLETTVVALVLVAAALHASWNALVKAGGDRLAMMALVNASPALVAWAAIPFLGVPDVASWPFLAASIVIHLGYYGALLFAYAHGDLSQVYPIARGTAPLLVAGSAWLLEGEVLSLAEALGITIVSLGIVALAWRRDGHAPHDRRAIAFALLTSLAIAGYSISDGMGVRRSGNELAYIAWLFAIDGLVVIAVALHRRRGRLRAAFAPIFARGLFGGLLAGTAYSIVIWAMSLGPMAHIIALRETSVILAAMIGTLLLKEPFGGRRIAAAAVVASGAVLLNAGF